MSQQLTDAELVARAYKLLNTSDIKSKLPQGYTLMMLWRASKAVIDAGIELLDEHGKRLEKLDSLAYKSLECCANLLSETLPSLFTSAN